MRNLGFAVMASLLSISACVDIDRGGDDQAQEPTSEAVGAVHVSDGGGGSHPPSPPAPLGPQPTSPPVAPHGLVPTASGDDQALVPETGDELRPAPDGPAGPQPTSPPVAPHAVGPRS
jgi:hypothetical protein